MARRLDGSDRGVLITQESARRIQRVVQRIEGGSRDIPPIHFRTAGDDDGGLRIGKYTGSSVWAKHTTATVEVWENGTPPNETSSSQTIKNVVNHWAAVPSGKWVGIQAAANGHYYLVVAEC